MSIRHNNGIITQDSGSIRVSPHTSSDPLVGSFIDTRDGKRRKYVSGKLHVWQNDTWELESAHVTDSNSSNGNAPLTGSAIRKHYLDAIEEMRLKQLQPAPEPTRTGVPAPAADTGLSIRERYLRDLARQSNAR